MNNNARIVMRRDTKPVILAGKQGLLGLPANVDFRESRNFEGRPVVPTVPTVSPSPQGHRASLDPFQRRSFLPLILFCAAIWAGLIVAAVLR